MPKEDWSRGGCAYSRGRGVIGEGIERAGFGERIARDRLWVGAEEFGGMWGFRERGKDGILKGLSGEGMDGTRGRNGKTEWRAVGGKM